MTPSPLLLLFFLVVPAFSATLFVISGTITCSSPYYFQYRMRVIEEDVVTDDILMTEPNVHFSTHSKVFYNITTSDTYDHGTTHYELELHVLHNCNSKVYTKNAKSVFKIGSYMITHGTHYITYDMDITDNGTPYMFELDHWAPIPNVE